MTLPSVTPYRKKRFGQHFLRDHNIARKIISCGDVTADDVVLEIGSGDGFFTRELLKQAGCVVALEIDREWYAALHQQLHNEKNVVLIEGDCCSIEWDRMPRVPNKLVANIPYNITSQILFRCIHYHSLLQTIVLMMQKEVAHRLVASPGTKIYGMPSVVMQTFFDITYCFTVSPHVFRPEPKVESGVVKLVPKQSQFSSEKDVQPFIDFVKLCFSQRRKALLGVLCRQYPELKSVLEAFWKSASLDTRARAENCSVATWHALYKKIVGT